MRIVARVVSSLWLAMGTLHAVPSTPVLPLVFVENAGQFDGSIAFAARSAGIALAVRNDGFAVAPAGVRFAFEGADPAAIVSGQDALEARVHFLVGDPDAWRVDRVAYGGVAIRGLYPGIDLELHVRNGVPEYDLVLAPGADLDAVVVRIDGIDDTVLAADGSMFATTRVGRMLQHAPIAYAREHGNERRALACSTIALGDRRFGFRCEESVGRSRVVDPGLEFATLLGGGTTGSGNTVADGAMGLAVDANGEMVIAGYASDPNFPVTPNAFDTSYESAVGVIIGDAFVARFDAEGKTLRFATFLGGNFGDQAYDVALDASGSPYVIGHTTSTTFPTSAVFGVQTVFGLVPYHTFLSKLSPTGSSLVYSVIVEDAMPQALVVDAQGAVFATGSAAGANGVTGFPVTANAVDTTYNGSYWDQFALKLNPSGTNLVFATLFGGSGTDNGLELTLDGFGGVYVGGRTQSPDFPTTSGAFDSNFSAFSFEATIAHFDGTGTQLFASTLLGADHGSQIESLRVAKNGDVVAAGFSWSPDGVILPNPFPVTPGAFDTLFEGDAEGFVSILDPTLGALTASTLLGDLGNDSITGMDIDANGRIVTVGGTNWTMPVTADALQSVPQSGFGYFDGTIHVFSSDLSTLLYGSYLGGSKRDVPVDVVVPIPGSIHIAGRTESPNFPTTVGAFDKTLGGYADAFALRLEWCPGGAFFQELAGGCAGAGGVVPGLRGDGCPQSGTLARLRVVDAAALAPALLVGGAAPGTTPWSPSCSLGLSALFPTLTIPLQLSAQGGAVLPLVVPPIPVAVDVYLQTLVLDPAAAGGVAVTNVLRAHAL